MDHLEQRRTRPARSGWNVGLLASLALVAALTLTPEGTGWAWGSPVEELTWYLTGLDSTATVLQLVGNLSLLAVPAALAVLRWPELARPARLTGWSLAAGCSIELAQRLLPLGRVVSPVDALLNATGAVVAGLVVSHLRWMRDSVAGHAVGPTADHALAPAGGQRPPAGSGCAATTWS
jgi:hypothetical protein